MILGLRDWRMALAVATAALGGCKVDPGTNPGFEGAPCYELQGDLTCQSLYASRPYCSLCATETLGCVILPPPTSCRPSGGSTAGPMPDDTGDDSTGGTSTGAVDSTAAIDGTGDSSTGEPPCEAEGELDPGCMALDTARPFCIDAVCVGCDDAGGDLFCGDLDGLAPACDAEAGACVGCGQVETSVCGDATPVCDASGACLACTAHAQCPDSACHLGPDDPLLGHCFAPDEVIWVDNTGSCPGIGSAEAPMCSLQAAASTIAPGDDRVLRVMGGMPYAERVSLVGAMTVAIIGDGDPQVGGNPVQQAATLLLDDGATAYVQGMNFVGNPMTHGVMCNMSYARIEDTEIRDNAGWGVFDFEPCTLDVRRTVITGNEDGGLRLAGGSLRLDNATVGINGIGGNSTGVRLENADADIVYSTIAGNDGSGSDSIECTNATGTLRNSIVTGLDAPSIDLDCFPLLMEHNAMDAANFAAGTNVEVDPYNEIYFDDPATGDFTLAAPPLTPFGGVALWLRGDPEVDADGTPRPTGGGTGYAGVDEP